MAKPIRLARIAGIDLLLHWTWFLVLVYEVEARAGAYSSIAWNVLEVLALFAIVTLHEFGHALACRQVGGKSDRILLWPFGGIAFVDAPPRPGATLWTIAAGPLVNVALVPVLALLPQLATAGDAATFLNTLQIINIYLLVFNLAPVYPLDGGQILQALLWFPLGRARSLMVTTVLGLVGVALLLLLALRTLDLWLGLMTFFILTVCWNGLKQARALWRLSRLPRHQEFACPWCHAAPPAEELWDCPACHHSFDPFATGAVCPLCSRQFARASCLECGHAFPWPEWSAPAGAAATVRSG